MWDFETPPSLFLLLLLGISSTVILHLTFVLFYVLLEIFFAGPFYPAVMRPSSHQGRVSAGQFATYWDFTEYEVLRATTTD